jgi:hypothetical protein
MLSGEDGALVSLVSGGWDAQEKRRSKNSPARGAARAEKMVLIFRFIGLPLAD